MIRNSKSNTLASVRVLICPEFLLGLTIVLGTGTTGFADDKTPEGKSAKKITYDEHVRPIFRDKCFSCHNQTKKRGDLDLTNFTNMTQGGASGEVIERGSASDSYLYLLVSHSSEPFMPPKSEKLAPESLAIIEKWIEGGALERSGSKGFVRQQPKFSYRLSKIPTDRPQISAMPGRIGLQPAVQTRLNAASTALATSPWSPLVAVAGQKQVLLYHSQTLRPLGVLPFPEGTVNVLKFSRNGSLLLAGGGRGASRGLVVVWDVKTGERVFETGDELDTVFGVDISADHSMIALGSSSKIVRCYSTANGELLYEIPKKHTDWIYCVSFSPDGVLLATSDRNGGMFVWEAETGREYLVLKGHGAAITGLSWRMDSNLLASCSEDRSIRLWEMENGRQVKSWTAHGDGTAALEFTRDGRLVSCGRDRVTKLWDQNGKQQRAFAAFKDLALSVTFCDETNRVVAGDWTGQIRVWDAKSGDDLGQLTSNPPKLQERLAFAIAHLTAKQNEHNKLAATYRSAQTAADTAVSQHKSSQALVAQLQQQMQALAATTKQRQQDLAKLAASIEAASKRAATLKLVVPLLQQTATNAKLTTAKAPDDKELLAIANQLNALSDKRTADFAEARKTVTEKSPLLAKTEQKLSELQQQAKESLAALTQNQERVDQLSAALKPAREKATTAKRAADGAAQTVAAAAQEVDRWQIEINVAQRIADRLANQREHAALIQDFQVTEAAVEQARSQLGTAKRAFAGAQQMAEATANSVIEAKQKMATATTQQVEVADRVAALEDALLILREALTKTQLAVSKAKDDKQLVEAASLLQSLVEDKASQLAASKQDSSQKKATVGQLGKQLAIAEQQASDAAQAAVAAQKLVADRESARQPLERQLVAARQAAADVGRKITAIQQEIDKL